MHETNNARNGKREDRRIDMKLKFAVGMLNSIAAGVMFGIWQQNATAGFFVYFVLMVYVYIKES